MIGRAIMVPGSSRGTSIRRDAPPPARRGDLRDIYEKASGLFFTAEEVSRSRKHFGWYAVCWMSRRSSPGLMGLRAGAQFAARASISRVGGGAFGGGLRNVFSLGVYNDRKEETPARSHWSPATGGMPLRICRSAPDVTYSRRHGPPLSTTRVREVESRCFERARLRARHQSRPQNSRHSTAAPAQE